MNHVAHFRQKVAFYISMGIAVSVYCCGKQQEGFQPVDAIFERLHISRKLAGLTFIRAELWVSSSAYKAADERTFNISKGEAVDVYLGR